MGKLSLNQLFQIPVEAVENQKEKTFVGIDFGTSTTVVSVAKYNARSKQVECATLHLVQKDADGNIVEAELMPTVIAINNDGSPLVGEGAYKMKGNPDYTFGENIWHSFKMGLGKDLGPIWYKSQQPAIKSPQDATRFFFKQLKRCIEKACPDSEIHYAVSIPASFESNQRKDLLEALEANGIPMTGKNLIDEPNAAFIGYINPDESYKEQIVLNDDYNPKVLVFDFGAGTCDISILEINADYQGCHTKNLSISQFTELGGNDIDKYIASNYLLPSLLESNDMEMDEYSETQKEVIVSQLLGIAELLKINICKDCEFLLDDQCMLDSVIAENGGRTVQIPVNIYTDYKQLKKESFTLKYSEFIHTMDVFFNKNIWTAYNNNKRKKRYNSIYTIIHSAIKKAHVAKNEIDYVMMVGGSSKNPFVQRKIKNYFGEGTRLLLPPDMQKLVSQGASIHSLMTNAFDISMVRPITSEPIVIITKDKNAVPVIPAGTEIPFTPVKIDRLNTGEYEKERIEIPICVSNEKKMLANLIIEAPEEKVFPANTPIELYLEMNTDKVLSARAICLGRECSIDTENPFANTYLTDEERKIMLAERETYIAADKNGGIPTKDSLIKLRNAYSDADVDYREAEVLEMQLKYYPQDNMYNRLGVLFHNSGNITKAIYYFRKAISIDEENPWPHSNLGHDLYRIGRYGEAKKELERAIELKADLPAALIILGELYSEEGDKETANDYFEQGYNILMRYFHNGQMEEYEYSWLLSAARGLGRKLPDEVQAPNTNRKCSYGFNAENLVSITKKMEVEV
jgi:molecular chaperone DnaK (HSP70)